MANEDAKGAFTQMDSAARVPSKLGALSSNFYGTDPSLGQSMGDVVRELMPTAADKERSSSMAFWGGFGAPNKSGSLSGQLGNATAAQSARELEGEKLKASYVPMITQAMLANQTQTLAGNKQVSDLAAAAAPHMNAALASLGTSGAKPTRSEAIDKAIATGKSLNLPLSMVQPYIDALPKNDEDIGKHIGQLGQSLSPGGFGNQLNRSATGELNVATPGSGTVSDIKQMGGASNQPATKNLNPTQGEANFKASALGDPKAFSEQLQSEAGAATNFVKDLNEIHKNVSEFTPGKYAEHAGKLAASLSDIVGRLPGVDKSQVEKLSNTLLNAPEGSKDALSALQMTDQLLSMNAMRTARDAAGGRASIPEFNAAHMAALASTSDPATFAKLDKFARENAERTVGRLGKFNEHLNNPDVKDKSILSFETKYHRDMLDDLTKQDKANTAERKDVAAKTAPAEAKPEVKPEVKVAPVDLKDYPAGTKLTASGKAFVTNPDGSHSYVKPIK